MKISRSFSFAAVVGLGLVLVLTTASVAQIKGVGGPYGEYFMEYAGPEQLTLFVVPNGSGGSFDQASLPIGGSEDATITLQLRDAGWNPVPDFPREDLWLESEDQGLILCPGGSIADANTDALGETRWTQPLFAGGHSEGRTIVLVSGATPELTIGVNLGYNSADINGDLAVNLIDVQTFTVDFYGSYDFKSDFNRDEIINLSDIVELAHAFGAACP